MEIDRSDAARALARLPRRRRTLNCTVCGREMEGTSRRKYCSVACMNRASRANAAARRTRLELESA